MTHIATEGHRYFQYSLPSNTTVWLPNVRNMGEGLVRGEYSLEARDKSENRKHDMGNQEELICRNADPIQ